VERKKEKHMHKSTISTGEGRRERERRERRPSRPILTRKRIAKKSADKKKRKKGY